MNFLPSKNADYAEVDYWNERYKAEDSYEWFKCYADFRHIVRSAVKPDHKILMLGCGNSRLSEDMYVDGYHDIVNIDYSPIVIERMRVRCKSSAPRMDWRVMDVTRNLPDFPPRSFDVVIEKGTLDAMLVAERDPWNVSPDNEQMMDNVLSQVSRLLRSDGRFVSITFSQPHFRRRLYAKPKYDWSFNYVEFGKSFSYFVYLMVKGEPLSDDVLSSMTKSDDVESISKTTMATDAFDEHEEHAEDFLNRICVD